MENYVMFDVLYSDLLCLWSVSRSRCLSYLSLSPPLSRWGPGSRGRVSP